MLEPNPDYPKQLAEERTETELSTNTGKGSLSVGLFLIVSGVAVSFIIPGYSSLSLAISLAGVYFSISAVYHAVSHFRWVYEQYQKVKFIKK